MTTTTEPVAKRGRQITTPLALITDVNLAETMSDDEARYIVFLYYSSQDMRIEAANKARSKDDEKPTEHLTELGATFQGIERHIAKIMKKWMQKRPLGEWLMETCGIGPILAAGIYVFLGMTHSNHVSGWWKFAGQAPGQKRKRGQKLDFNPDLKKLCWKIGDSFVKVSGNDKSLYGKLYRERKAYEDAKNETGDYAEQAAHALASKKWSECPTKKCYESGKLSPGHLDMRARRWATKIFLAHAFMQFQILEKGEYTNTWARDHGGHVDMIQPEVAFVGLGT